MFVEGCYPYIVGGVSGWVQMMIEARKELDFSIYTLLPDREQCGKFQYKIPDNVLEIREAYLNDKDRKRPFSRKTRWNKEEKECFRKLLFGDNVDWKGVFEYFEKPNISVNDLLMGNEFFEIVQDLYISRYPQCVFTDFLWSVRSLYLPLFTILKVPVEEADCYHAISTGYAGVLACKGYYLHHRPVLLTEHGIYTREREEEIIKVDWTQGIYKDLWIRYFYTLSECIYQCASQVISLFQAARTIQVELGCPKEKTRVVSNGVYTDQFLDIPQKGESETTINIGAVLRIVPIKDVKTMLNAYALAKESVPQLKLYLMGPKDENPEYYKECLELIKNFDIQDVLFTGRVNVRDYIGKMDMVILTSISEGQPLCLLEAMAAMKPCIATDVGGCKELLYGNEMDTYGKSGIIVPVMSVSKIAQAIVTLAKDKSLRAEMGYVGRLRVKSFYQNEQVTETYREIYAQYHDGK